MAETTLTEPQKTANTAKVLHKKHPLAIRWFHWINFPVLFIMIWSGLTIYWANTAFHITIFGWSPFHMVDDDHKIVPLVLFPDSWFHPAAPKWVPGFLAKGATPKELWSMDGRLADGMAWHFLFAWFFALNGLAYVLFLALSGQWRKIVPKPKAVIEAIQVILIDLRLSKAKMPVRKYNAAQQIAYTGVIVMGLLMLLTGVAIYKPAEQSWLTRIFFGYTGARFIHFWTTMGFLAFFLVHVGQVIRTGWNNFRGMVTGYELVTPDEKSILEEQL